MNAEQLGLEPAAGFRKGPDLEKGFLQEDALAACSPACFPRSQAQGESELGQLTSSESLAEARETGLSSSLKVSKEFSLNHKVNKCIF